MEENKWMFVAQIEHPLENELINENTISNFYFLDIPVNNISTDRTSILKYLHENKIKFLFCILMNFNHH